MTNFKRISLGSLLAVAAATGCDEPVPSPEPSEVDFRAGTRLSFSGTTEDGRICFDFDYQCEDPELISLERNGTQQWVWSPASIGEGETIEETPDHLCLFTPSSAGYQLYSVEATCDGQSSSMRRRFYTTPASLSVNRVSADRTYYSAGDTINLEVDATFGAMLSVDFSAVDSGYFPGAETVTSSSTGGPVTVSYTLSSVNSVAAGDHEIVVTVADPASGVARNHRMSIRFLPDGPMNAHVARGVYRPEARPAMLVNSSLILDAVTDTGLDIDAPVTGDLQPNFDVVPAPSDGAHGHKFDLAFRTTGPDPLPALSVDIWEDGRDGFTRVPLDVSSASCTALECTYSDSILVRNKDGGDFTSGLPIQLSLVSEGLASGGANAYVPAVPPPPATSFRVKGTITYPAQEMSIECPTFPNTDMECPQDMVEEVRPARRMSVRIVDGCGGVTQTWTDDEGHIDRWGQTFCPNDPASIVISSYHEPAPLTISVFQHAQQPPVFPTLGDLTDFLTNDPNDYTVPNQAVVGFVPALDALGPGGFDFNAAVTDDTVATSISIAETARRSLDYYDGWTDLSNEVHVNVLWDESEVVESGNYNFYQPTVHPGMIHIHPRSGWSDFAMAHESGHLFHYFYLRNHGPGVNNPPYGRFGEPMANVHAAAIVRSGWMTIYDTNSKAETLDYNGKFEQNLGGAKQAEMDFYADPLAAAATLQCGGMNEDECCDEPNAVAQGNCVMRHSQGWDWRIYFDLLDGPGWLNPEPVDEFIAGGNTIPAGDFDDFDGNLGYSWGGDAINDVLIHYLGRDGNANPEYEDRGRTMIDLVDVLDGLSCRGHVTQADMEELLEDAMGYDYDFAYVGSACP